MAAGKKVLVTSEERWQLERTAASPTSPQRDALRARIVLGLADGVSGADLAESLNTSRQAVSRWRGRWMTNGLAGLQDTPGRGRKSSLDEAILHRVLQVENTVNPEGGKWSTRAMARLTGVSHMTIHRLWSAYDLQPHLRSVQEAIPTRQWNEILEGQCHPISVTEGVEMPHVAVRQSNGGRRSANAIASIIMLGQSHLHIAARPWNASQTNKRGAGHGGDIETAIRTKFMGNLTTSKDAKGKKGPVQGGGGPVVVVLEESVAKDLFLALAQALGAPIDKKKKKKKKKKDKGGGKKAGPVK